MSYVTEKMRDGSGETQLAVKFQTLTIAVVETEEEAQEVIEAHKNRLIETGKQIIDKLPEVAEAPLIIRQFFSRAFIAQMEVEGYGNTVRFILPFRASDGLVTPSAARARIYEWCVKTEGKLDKDDITTADMYLPYATDLYAAHVMLLSRRGRLEEMTWFSYAPTGEVLLAEQHKGVAHDDSTFILPEYDSGT